MPTTTTIDSVTTEDAAPTVTPNRISAQPGKDHADFLFTPTHDGDHFPCPELVPGAGALAPDTYQVPKSTLVPSEGWFPGKVEPIIAVKIVDGGVDPYTGTVVGRYGLVCSDSEPCSDALPCSDWESPSGVQLAEDVKYAEEGASPTEGSHTINVWVNTVGQGWS